MKRKFEILKGVKIAQNIDITVDIEQQHSKGAHYSGTNPNHSNHLHQKHKKIFQAMNLKNIISERSK